MKAYLDIETTGLSPWNDDVTVVGVSLGSARNRRVVQLVGPEVTAPALLAALEGADTLCTYNGARFDLPFLKARLGVDLQDAFEHHDLMLDCWRCGLYGGLKAVERALGIRRKLPDVDGRTAVRLWWAYVRYRDHQALNTLLEYNKEDVLNLKLLERLLRTS